MEKLSQIQKKNFYRKLITLGVPLAIQQFVTSLTNLLDTFMLGGVDENVLAAAGLANKLFFVFSVSVFGASTGAAIFISQYFGKGDKQTLQKYLGISLVVAAALGALFTLTALLMPRQVMQIFTKDPVVIEYGIAYLRIVGISYIPTALSMCFYNALKSTRHPYIPLLFALSSLIGNAALNYVFIYVLNFGIKGAAMTTVFIRVAEFSFLALILTIRKTSISAPIKCYFQFTKEEIKNYFKFAGFVIFTEFQWSVGNVLYSIAFKKYGTTFQASVQVADSFMTLLNVFAIALGSAAAVIIGITIGEGKSELAIQYAKKLWLLSVLFGIVIGIIMAALSPFLPLMFTKLTDTGKSTTSLCLLIMAVATPVRCAEFMLMVGILRSGGDTKFCIMCDAVGVWSLTLPVLLLSAYVLNFPFLVTYGLINLEMLFKALAGTIRLKKSKKWLHNVTDNG